VQPSRSSRHPHIHPTGHPCLSQPSAPRRDDG
jgi:hypothetical protein